MPSTTASPAAWLANAQFHRTFTLPADPTSQRPGPLRITYSDIGYVPSAQSTSTTSTSTSIPTTSSSKTPAPPAKATVLFIGGLMGGRYTLLPYHTFCLEHQIRLICVDRPGMGGSTPIPLSRRMQTWMDTLPALLKHLGVEKVAVVCHSGGAVYMMNTLLRHGEFLEGRGAEGESEGEGERKEKRGKVKVCFLAPWVYPRDSGMNHLLLVPGWGAGKFDGFIRGVNGVAGAVGVLGGFSTGLLAMSSGSLGISGSGGQTKRVIENEGEDDGNGTDEDDKWMNEMQNLIVKYLFAEDISGSSDEMKLLLRKDQSVQRWGGEEWENYEEVMKLIASQYGENSGQGLDVKVFHAATDRLNGAGGARYFDECWEKVSRLEGSDIAFMSRRCKGTDHDSIVDPIKGPLKEWLLDLVKEE